MHSKGRSKMNSRFVVLAALLSCAFASASNATTHTTNLGALEDADFGVVSDVFFLPQTFQDTFNFTLSSTSTITGLMASVRLVDAGSLLDPRARHSRGDCGIVRSAFLQQLRRWRALADRLPGHTRTRGNR